MLVFDDIHWGEATFLDLVEHIAEWTREAPILLICLARPELLEVRPSWGGGKLNATSVLLEPLTPVECGLLIKGLVGQEEFADEVETRIAEAAEGNPLFVEEMLSMLVDDGVIVRAEGRWATTRDLASVPVPPTIHALLGARLDRLTAAERSVIERASVEGKVFHQGSIAALASERAAACHRDASGDARAQGPDPPRPDRVRDGPGIPLSPSPDSRRGLRLDPEGDPRGVARAVRPLARESRREASGCMRRSSAITSSRRTAIAARSAPSTTRRALSPVKPPSDWARRATEPSSGATPPPP